MDMVLYLRNKATDESYVAPFPSVRFFASSGGDLARGGDGGGGDESAKFLPFVHSCLVHVTMNLKETRKFPKKRAGKFQRRGFRQLDSSPVGGSVHSIIHRKSN